VRAGVAGPPPMCRGWRRDGRSRHTRDCCLTGNDYCLCQGIKEQATHAHLMLDVLIERVSYDPMAIFMIVAVVLLIMLARTL